MSDNHSIQYLRSCLSLVSGTLGAEEAILVIEKGETRYGKQTFVYHRVRIGTFKNMTGNTPVDLRSAVVEINVDAPEQPRFVDESFFRPPTIPR